MVKPHLFMKVPQMQLINAPGKLVLPFAASGAKNAIPVASQIGIVAGAASLTDGFPPLTRTVHGRIDRSEMNKWGLTKRRRVHGRIDRSEKAPKHYTAADLVHGRIDRSENTGKARHYPFAVHGRIDRSEKDR